MIENITVAFPDIDDIKKAACIEAENFPHPWSEDDFIKQANDNNSLFLVAKSSDEVVGYISVSVVLDEASINTLAVDKKHRRKGVARALINSAFYELNSRCSFLTLEVRESNHAAISLYSSLGFETVGKRPHFYRDPDESAILMTKYLN